MLVHIPSLDETPGYESMMLGLDSLASERDDMIAMEGNFLSSVNNVALKMLDKQVQANIQICTNWYHNATKSMDQFFKSTKKINTKAISDTAAAFQVLKRQEADVKKIAHNFRLPKSERKEAQNELDQIRAQRNVLLDRQLWLASQIYIPKEVSEFYGQALQSVNTIRAAISAMYQRYLNIIEAEPGGDIHNLKYPLDADDEAKLMLKLRDDATAMKNSNPVFAEHRKVFSIFGNIAAAKPAASQDDLTPYPVKEFLAMSDITRNTWADLNSILSRMRKHSATLKEWQRDPKQIDMDWYKVMSNEIQFCAIMEQAIAEWFKCYLQLCMRVLDKAENPEFPDTNPTLR